MNRLALLLASGCLWAVMMFLLFEREIRPYFDYQQPPTYRLMLRDRRTSEAQRRGIFLASDRIGEAETLIVPRAEGGTVMETRLSMHMQPFLRMTLQDDLTSMVSEVVVDDDYQLSRFAIKVRVMGIPATVKGERQGEKLKVAYTMMLFEREDMVDFPRDAMLADSFLPYQGGARLKEGKKWRMRLLDMDSMMPMKGKREAGFTDVYAAVVGREAVRVQGREVPCFKVEVRKKPTDAVPAYTLWVDNQGGVARQLTMINKMPCTIVLEEQRPLSPEEARSYAWQVQETR